MGAGVVLTHQAVVTTVASLATYIEDLGLQLGEEQHSDVMLSYLPLAHVFDRVSEEMMLGCGGAVVSRGLVLNGVVETRFKFKSAELSG